MFRAIMCPSSGELTVSMRHWYFSLCMGACLVCCSIPDRFYRDARSTKHKKGVILDGLIAPKEIQKHFLHLCSLSEVTRMCLQESDPYSKPNRSTLHPHIFCKVSQTDLLLSGFPSLSLDNFLQCHTSYMPHLSHPSF